MCCVIYRKVVCVVFESWITCTKRKLKSNVGKPARTEWWNGCSKLQCKLQPSTSYPRDATRTCSLVDIRFIETGFFSGTLLCFMWNWCGFRWRNWWRRLFGNSSSDNRHRGVCRLIRDDIVRLGHDIGWSNNNALHLVRNANVPALLFSSFAEMHLNPNNPKFAWRLYGGRD